MAAYHTIVNRIAVESHLVGAVGASQLLDSLVGTPGQLDGKVNAPSGVCSPPAAAHHAGSLTLPDIAGLRQIIYTDEKNIYCSPSSCGDEGGGGTEYSDGNGSMHACMQ